MEEGAYLRGGGEVVGLVIYFEVVSNFGGSLRGTLVLDWLFDSCWENNMLYGC